MKKEIIENINHVAVSLAEKIMPIYDQIPVIFPMDIKLSLLESALKEMADDYVSAYGDIIKSMIVSRGTTSKLTKNQMKILEEGDFSNQDPTLQVSVSVVNEFVRELSLPKLDIEKLIVARYLAFANKLPQFKDYSGDISDTIK